jgi:hypothetical protein
MFGRLDINGSAVGTI